MMISSIERVTRWLSTLPAKVDQSRVFRSLRHRLRDAQEDAAYWCGYKDGRLHRALASTTNPVYLAGYADGVTGRSARPRLR